MTCSYTYIQTGSRDHVRVNITTEGYIMGTVEDKPGDTNNQQYNNSADSDTCN